MRVKHIGLLFCMLCWVSNSFSQEVIDQVVAVVGNKIVLKSDIENQYSQYIAQGNTADEGLKCKLLDQLLLNKLLVNQAIVDSVPVSDEQVETELDRKLRYFIAQIGSQEKLEQYFKKTILELKSEYRDLLREQLQAQAMQAKITKEVTATPSDVRGFFATLSGDSVPFINAEYELVQITQKAPISKSEEDAVKERLEGFRQRILKGEDFGTLAVLYSEDPGSARKNGELGMLPRGSLVPEFEVVAYNLKPGEISGIVHTQFGYHLIQLIERRGNEINCRHILLKPKVQATDLAIAKQRIDSVAALISNGTISFNDAASKYSDDENKSNGGLMVNQQTGTSKFEADQLEPTLLFQIDKMKQDEVSQPLVFQSQDGSQGYRLVKLKSKVEAHKANLKDDYQRIQAAALAYKQNKVLQEWVNKKKATTYIQINGEARECKEAKAWLSKSN